MNAIELKRLKGSVWAILKRLEAIERSASNTFDRINLGQTMRMCEETIEQFPSDRAFSVLTAVSAHIRPDSHHIALAEQVERAEKDLQTALSVLVKEKEMNEELSAMLAAAKQEKKS